MVGKLVGGWLRDVGGGGEGGGGVRSLLDMLIDHCYRWLTNPYSKMYEVCDIFFFLFFSFLFSFFFFFFFFPKPLLLGWSSQPSQSPNEKNFLSSYSSSSYPRFRNCFCFIFSYYFGNKKATFV